MSLERDLIKAVLEEKAAMVLELDADIEKEQDPELVEEFKATRQRIIDGELDQLKRECAYYWTEADDSDGKIAQSLIRYHFPHAKNDFTKAMKKRSKDGEERR